MNNQKKSRKPQEVIENVPLEVTKMRTRNNSEPSTAADSPPSDSGSNSFSRHQRNLAEKQRRDKLNNYINELASLVPFVSMSNKKLDKTSILRLSAAHLRLHQSPLNPRRFKKFSWKPDELDADYLNEIFNAFDGFLLVTNTWGKIIFATKSSENYLGHQDIEMIGHSLMSFVHPIDQDNVKKEINKMVSPDSNETQRCSFCARMREKSQPRTEVVSHQMMHFSCRFDSCKETNHNRNDASSKKSKKLQVMNSTNIASDGILKIFLKPININPVDELTITEAFQEEYVTKHGIDGKIIYVDHRISTITGHLPHEVMGMLAYDYILPADVPVAHFAQKLMFSSSNGIGLIVYRLKTRNSTYVYLKTIGHLQYDKGSTKVSHFVCINKLLGQKEGEDELRKFTDRYSPHIKDTMASTHPVRKSSLKSIESCPETNNIISVVEPVRQSSTAIYSSSPPETYPSQQPPIPTNHRNGNCVTRRCISEEISIDTLVNSPNPPQQRLMNGVNLQYSPGSTSSYGYCSDSLTPPVVETYNGVLTNVQSEENAFLKTANEVYYDSVPVRSRKRNLSNEEITILCNGESMPKRHCRPISISDMTPAANTKEEIANEHLCPPQPSSRPLTAEMYGPTGNNGLRWIAVDQGSMNNYSQAAPANGGRGSTCHSSAMSLNVPEPLLLCSGDNVRSFPYQSSNCAANYSNSFDGSINANGSRYPGNCYF